MGVIAAGWGARAAEGIAEDGRREFAEGSYLGMEGMEDGFTRARVRAQAGAHGCAGEADPPNPYKGLGNASLLVGPSAAILRIPSAASCSSSEYPPSPVFPLVGPSATGQPMIQAGTRAARLPSALPAAPGLSVRMAR